MTSLTRIFYATAAAFATWCARRRQGSCARWMERAERWSARARATTKQPGANA